MVMKGLYFLFFRQLEILRRLLVHPLCIDQSQALGPNKVLPVSSCRRFKYGYR